MKHYTCPVCGASLPENGAVSAQREELEDFKVRDITFVVCKDCRNLQTFVGKSFEEF